MDNIKALPMFGSPDWSLSLPSTPECSGLKQKSCLKAC